MYHKLKLHNKRIRTFQLPEFLQKELEKCTYVSDDSADVIINSIIQLKELEEIAHAFLAHKHEGKILYVVYPKLKTTCISIHRDVLIHESLRLGLQPIKLISVNEKYSCMGFKAASSVESGKVKRPSQCVNDYIDRIEPLQNKLAEHPMLLEFYKTLTPGYQKDWARFVYSAVQAKTQEHRFQQMCDALVLKCKNIEQFKARKNTKSC